MRIRNSFLFNSQNRIHKALAIIIVLAVIAFAAGAVRFTLKRISGTQPGPTASKSPNANPVSELDRNKSSNNHDTETAASTDKKVFSEDSSAAKKKPQEQTDGDPLLLSEVDSTKASTADSRRSRMFQDRDSDANRTTQNSSRNDKAPGDLKPTESHLKKAHPFDGDLRSLPYVPPVKRERPEREPPEILRGPDPLAGVKQTAQPMLPEVSVPSPAAPAPTPIATFDGLDFANWGNGHPPDTNGDVGPTHYIQTVNTSIGVYNKSTGVRVAAFTFDTFMSQGNFGNLCDTDNFGDPVVLYDTFEDRWIITDFAFQLDGAQNVINPPGAFQCFAVSKTADPVSGGWNFYSINTTGGLGDYPKFGIWPDGLYMSANMYDYAAAGSFQNVRVYAFNKAQMYAGAPTVQSVFINLPSDQFTVLPANARLQTGTPPSGSPNYMASVWNFLNSEQIWKFSVNWATPAAASVTGPFSSTMAFWWAQTSGTTAPTPRNALDTLYPRMMMQNQYTNIGGVESVWTSHTVAGGVNPNPTTNVSGVAQSAVRYYQVNVTGGTVAANTTQSFTYSPDTTVYRYMPSAAVDRLGDMAIGYTTSNAATNPGIKYAGRFFGDAANSITQTEQTLFQGTGSQLGNCGGTCTRWGDYSAMTLDPDGCTFWYTNEYYATDGLNDLTRIGSFKLNPACTVVGSGTVSGAVTANPGGAAISGATVSLGSRATTTDGSGNYSFTGIPAGTYPTMSASFPGRTTGTASSIVVTAGGTTTQNFSLSAASQGTCFTDTTQTDFFAGVNNNTDLTTSAGNVVLTNPANLNQSNTTLSGSGFTLSTTAWKAQGFTPSVTGTLVKADINLFCSGCTGTTPNLTLSVRATSSGLPTGADLASGTITGFSNGGAVYYSVTFASPPTLTAGTVYALVVRPVSNPSVGTYAVTVAGSNVYAGGRISTSANGAAWSVINPSDDAGFHIYMSTGYSTSGDYTSGLKDSNPAGGPTATTWTTLSWTNLALPSGTNLKFQIAASNNSGGPFNFVGPDSTSGTFFATSGASLSQFNGFRYLKYKAYLTTSNTANTPTLNDVTVCYQDLQDLVFNANGSVAPGAYNSITVNGPAIVDLTGNVTITGFVQVNSGGRLNLGSSIISGGGTFTLASGGILGIGSANGITSSGASGNVQGAGARSFSTGASYVYTGATNQAVGNGLPATVANLTVANTGSGGNNTVTGNSGQIVTTLLEVQSGIYVSASTYHNVQIDVGATLSLSGDVTVSGDWTNNGTFNANGFKVTFDGNTNQSISGSSSTAFANLTIANTGVVNNTITLSQNISDTSLNITTGKLDQGASSNLTSGAVVVSSGATWRNLGAGDVTLSGGVANAGTVTLQGNGATCGQNDDISIRSSVNGTQRAWSGAGTFSINDVDVKDQAGTAIITAFSSTNSGNNGANWIISTLCTTGQIYTWVGSISTDWNIAGNWSPTRTIPAASDILVINNGFTPMITNVPSLTGSQTIAALRITNGTGALLSARTGGGTLTINGGAGSDLEIDSGSSLTLQGASDALTVDVDGAGSTGVVGGQIVVQNGAHQVLATNGATITFSGTNAFTTASSYSATTNPFGTGTAPNGSNNSIIFASGAGYAHNNGLSPFGDSGHNVVTFQTGSTARFLTSTGFEASGRTYANLVIGSSSTQVVASQSGTGNFQFDDLAINSTGSLQSSLTYTGSGSSTITIRGNITSSGNGNGGTFPDLILTAGSGGIQINKPGGGTVAFSNGAGTPAHSIDLESDVTVDTLTTVNLGRIVQMGLGPAKTITVNGSIVPNSGNAGYVIGNEKRPFTGPGPASFTFDVGTVNGYSPVDAQNTTSAGNLTVIATQSAAPVVDTTKSLKRYWTLSGSGITTNLTFHYLDPADIPGTSTEANYRVIRVESGTSVSFPNDGCLSACVDTANNKGTVVGVSHFSDWTLGEPAAPTAVKLTKFGGESYEDGVELSWESGFEVDNLGYHIYRERNGQRERVTEGLVAGSALKVGPRSQLRAGYGYAWFDKAGTADTAYYLEAIDLNGTRELTGPIYPTRGSGKSPRGIKRAALLSEVNGNAETDTFEQSWPAALGSSPNLKLESAPADALGQQAIANGAAVKISVSRTGWYRVTQPELLAAGLDPNSDPRRLQMFVGGEEIPIIVNANGSRFGAGDSIEFYGQSLDSLSTDTQIYWLINGSSAGKRIDRTKPVKGGNQDWTNPGGNFAMTVTRADKLIYFSSLLNGEASNIFGPVITGNAATQSLTVNNLDGSSTQAQLSVTLQGATEVDHQVQVQLNGTPVGTVSFTGRQHPTQSFTVSRSLLHEGANLVTLASVSGGLDVSLVDTVSLTYAHSYRADNNALRFSVPAGRTAIVSGFSSAAIRLIDITYPAIPNEILPPITALDGGYALRLQTNNSGGTRTFLAFTDDLASHPAALTANQPSNLTGMPGADLLIVTHRDFRSAVEPLAAQRRSEGLSVNVVDIEDVYDEFSFGAHSPAALRDFLSWTNNHGTRPRYLLLVGDSSWDPRNSLNQGFADFVPTKLIDTFYLETASDDWLSDFDGDGIADIATGRLPVRTAADATLIINKILAYEHERQTGAPLRGALLVADSGFESESTQTAALLPSGMSVTTINRADVGSDDLTRTQIVNGLNNGPLVANYFGHGSVTVWTGAGLLDSDLATNLTNNNRPTLFVLMTCLNGYSHDAYIDSLGESLLKAQNGGAMAVWASSGFTESDPQFVMSSQFYRQLFSSTSVRLGDAFKPAKATISDPDVQRTWILLGDPSMRLR